MWIELEQEYMVNLDHVSVISRNTDETIAVTFDDNETVLYDEPYENVRKILHYYDDAVVQR